MFDITKVNLIMVEHVDVIAMADERSGSVTVGCKTARWKRDALKLVASRQRTTVSSLLRDRVDDILDECDINESDIPYHDGGAADK